MKIKSYNKTCSRLGLDGITLKSKSHGDNNIQLIITECDDGFDVVLKKPPTTNMGEYSGWVGNVTLLDRNHPSEEYNLVSDGATCHLTSGRERYDFRAGVPLRTPKLVLTVIPHHGLKHGTIEIVNNSETYHVKNVEEFDDALRQSALVDVVSITKLYACSGQFKGGENTPSKPNGDTVAHTMYHLNYIEVDGQLKVVNEIHVWDGQAFTRQ